MIIHNNYKQNFLLHMKHNNFCIIQIPGDTFTLGDHIIKYVATDINQQSSICEFTISVKGLIILSFSKQMNIYRTNL